MSDHREEVVTLHPSEEFERFRELILSDEIEELNGLGQRLEKSQRPEEIGRRLPESFLEAQNHCSDALVESLRSPVENAVVRSIETDRNRMASALFPILGPAIRLYVTELFRGMVDQLNETIKNATSLRQLIWRLEARRAGVPYSEYVILKTLNYRIDGVLLVHPQSGLLMQRVSRGNDGPMEENPELVSSMLIAIRSFARDSFASHSAEPNSNDDANLNRFSFGDYEIFIETGPHAILAAVGSGTPPRDFKHQMGEVLEDLHIEFPKNLREFDGDIGSLEGAGARMEPLLIENKGTAPVKTARWPFFAVVFVLLIGLIAWAVHSSYIKKEWRKGIAALREAPGIEVIEMEQIGRGKKRIHLLQDPTAKDPTGIVKNASKVAKQMEFRISPYLSMEPGICRGEAQKAGFHTKGRP